MNCPPCTDSDWPEATQDKDLISVISRNIQVILKQFLTTYFTIMAPYLPLREGDDLINHCARGWVPVIAKQSRVDTFCYNDKCHSVWFVSIDLRKF